MITRLCILIQCITAYSEGVALLSPSEVAVVCRAGDRLELTCSTTGSLLQWSLLLFNNEGALRTYTRHITSIDKSQQMSQLTVNSSVFYFSRISIQGDLTLISTLIINPVSIGLEGTMVNCTEVGNSVNTSSVTESGLATATIHFVREKLDSPLVTIRNNSTRFWRHSVSVTLNWLPQTEFNVSYSISAVPPAQILTSSTESEAHITVTYNVPYSVSVVAIQCGLESTPTIIELNYTSCDYPLQGGIELEFVQVAGYRVPALQGTTVKFSCPPGQVLKGPNMATCMEGGQWEPDPSVGQVKCIDNCGHPTCTLVPISYAEHCNMNITNGLQVCQFLSESADVVDKEPNNPNTFCLGNKTTHTCTACVTPALFSSLTVVIFIVASSIFCIIGAISGQLIMIRSRKQFNETVAIDDTQNRNPNSRLQTSMPTYENIQAEKVPEKDPKLTRNMAYDVIKLS